MQDYLYKVTASASPALTGTATIPGDKSISHRALMLGGLANGETHISGLLEAEDIFQTASAVRALGARLLQSDAGLWRLEGTGTGNLREPDHILDMGNSGTSTRLLAGLIAGHFITVTMTGDRSLTKRPMARITAPLTDMGAKFLCRTGECLPLTMRGAAEPKAIEYRPPVASAQVKSAILLAGLNTEGRTTVIESRPTRDHTEKMIRHFGGTVEIEDLDDGSQAIHVEGPQQLKGCAVDVPGDPSSAAFPAVAGCLIENSEIRLPRIGINPRRHGLYTTLEEMGADISYEKRNNEGGEPLADLVVRGGDALKGVEVPESRVPLMIDEFPILAVAAACAKGTTKMTGLAELRVKESDRLQMMADGLSACGVEIETTEDSLTIHGTGTAPRGGALIETAMDHRIAMSFLVLGLVSEQPVSIDDHRPIKTSFPNFISLMQDLGAPLDTPE